MQKSTKKSTFDKNGVYQCCYSISYLEYHNDNPQSFLLLMDLILRQECCKASHM